jgi:pyruvate/2-oxoglutarate dehydrogenase complex dihydrolipoamide dehydrogenase (E3) component
MSDLLQPDLCILGGGAAGAELAARAAESGLSVVLVEKRRVGGAKHAVLAPGHALLAASRFAATLRRAAQFGIDIGEPLLDFEQIQKKSAAVAGMIAANETQVRLEALNVRVIEARGQFAGRNRLEAGRYEIRARHFVIATGASVKPFPVRGMDLIRPLTYESLCRLKNLPRHLVVLGEDPFGLALAQAFRRFGAAVTVLAPSTSLAFVDEELAAPVRNALARDGVVVHEGVTVSHVEPLGEGVRVFLAGGPGSEVSESAVFEGSHLLLASAGDPVVEGLGLAAAGIRYDARGIKVDRRQRTSNYRVFAIGGVVKRGEAGEAGTNVEGQAGFVLHALLGRHRGQVPPPAFILMTDPEIAVSGLAEAQARVRFGTVRILRWPLNETDGARFQRAGSGHVKLITTAAGTIIGAGIVGTGAGELINLCTLAISKRMTASELASIMVPYPALSEAPRCAAAAACSTARGPSFMYRLSRLAHRLG